jgi:hypothetical protein
VSPENGTGSRTRRAGVLSSSANNTTPFDSITLAANCNQCGATPADWEHCAYVLGLKTELLPVVSNPNATISPKSELTDLGKVPSCYNGQRRVIGFPKWTEYRATDDDIAKWSETPDLGICIQTRAVRALDCDITNPALAVQVKSLITERIGSLPCRMRSNGAKFLLAFRLTGSQAKRTINTASGKIEFLATGQQFIAVGTHPSGVRYEWEGGLPQEIPELNAAEFKALWSSLTERFGIGQPVGRPAPRISGWLERVTEETINDLRDALKHIGPDDYDTWIRAGQALKCLGDSGRELWIEWSQRSAKFKEEKNIDRRWDGFDGKRTGYQAMFAEAQREGWVNPRSNAARTTNPPAARIVAGKADIATDPEADEFAEAKTAREIMGMPAVPVQYLVSQRVPPGLVIIGGRPKSRKSWYALQLGIACAAKRRFMGVPPRDGRVLYIALEDNDPRMRQRLAFFGLTPETAPENLHLVYEWPMGIEGAEKIERWLARYPDTVLVIVDVLARFRGPRDQRQSAYDADYLTMGMLHGIAARHTGLAVLVVHHVRKGAVDDAVEAISGTFAIAGAADAYVILRRGGGEQWIAHVDGRDWDQWDHEFVWEFKQGEGWVQLGVHENDLTGHQREIVQLAREMEGLTPTTLARAHKVAKSTAFEALDALVKKGALRRDKGKYFGQGQ